MCPRLPVDGKKVIEHRITLGRIEREILRDAATSYRIQSIDIEGMLRILEDPSRVVQIAYGIATALEMLGIETGWPTAADLVPWLLEKRAYTDPFTGEPGSRSLVDVLQAFWAGELFPGGTWPGGY